MTIAKPAITILTATAFLAGASNTRADDLVSFEAESGARGSDISLNSGGTPVYISPLVNNASANPGSATRVVSYVLNFPSPGTYQLYARMRVGANGYDDDSMFFATSFGLKTPTLSSDWVLVNGLAGAGYSNAGEVVAGSGSAGNLVWKWLNLSQFTGHGGFTVTEGNLSQTFQIGTREDGLDLDKFLFGTIGTAFTVSNLDNGSLPTSNLNTNLFVGPDGITIHRFSATSDGLNLDGANPASGVTLVNGVLYGTTLNGGEQGAGALYTVSTDGTNFDAVSSFPGEPSVGNPSRNLTLSGGGFFGTSIAGGNNGVGAVFALATNGAASILRSFNAVSPHTATNSGGSSPNALLTLSGATLYGCAVAGGGNGHGTLFSITTNGSAFTVLHDFSRLDANTGSNLDGAQPSGGLVLSGGTLYGCASAGGLGGAGVVFSVDANGNNFTVLHHFDALDPLTLTNHGGAIPAAGLIADNGTLYGTTLGGGPGAAGVVFSLDTSGLGFTVLHSFAPADPLTGTNNGGAGPVAPLLLSSNGLYGTASAGGTGAAGTVFRVGLDGTDFMTLHDFLPLADSGTNSHGAYPVAGVLRLDNALYGTAFSGGPGASGTAFRIPIPAPPAVITNILKNGDGTVTLHFLGGPNSTNIIQAAATMASPTDWQDISTNVADANGEWQFSETGNNSNRFYRSYAH